MVFPSVPVYLDPPNWNQQAHHQPGSSRGGGGGEAPQLPTGAVPPLPEGPMAGSIRPGSMAERARLAKIPQPEPALKCPRCDSSNTKFCYFNNYSLSQPRHFCKTCRRYWTRGGALRNVPVGGGCRRNKRTKSANSSSSKSSATTIADRQACASASTSSTATSVGIGSAIPSNLPMPPQLPFMTPSLHPLADYNAPNIGLSFAGIQPVDAVDYQVGISSSSGGGVGLEQWRFPQIQQFPFLGGLETTLPPTAPVPGLFPFDGEGGGVVGGGFGAGPVHMKATGSGIITQLASVKMEDNRLGLSLPRQYSSVPRNDQYWGGSSGGGSSGGGGWAPDLSGFNSSSAGNLL